MCSKDVQLCGAPVISKLSFMCVDESINVKKLLLLHPHSPRLWIRLGDLYNNGVHDDQLGKGTVTDQLGKGIENNQCVKA